MISITKFTDKIVKHKISPNQMYILACLMENSKIDLSRCWNVSFKYKELVNQEIKDLISRGFLEVYDKDKKVTFENVGVSAAFRADFYVDLEVAADELYDSYFDIIEINGQRHPGKNISKDVFTRMYIEKINGDLDTHRKILEATKKYVDGRTIGIGKLGLKKYIETEFYNSLMAEDSGIHEVKQQGFIT